MKNNVTHQIANLQGNSRTGVDRVSFLMVIETGVA